MLAIIKTGGKQYKVKEQNKVRVEKIEAKEGDKISFDQVLFVGDENEVKVGTPFLKGAKVEAEVIGQVRSKKVKTIKHKAKKRYLKRQGHKQDLTEVKIVKIAG